MNVLRLSLAPDIRPTTKVAAKSGHSFRFSDRPGTQQNSISISNNSSVPSSGIKRRHKF